VQGAERARRQQVVTAAHQDLDRVVEAGEERPDQAGLADPCFTLDHDDRAAAGPGRRRGGVQGGQLRVALQQRGRLRRPVARHRPPSRLLGWRVQQRSVDRQVVRKGRTVRYLTRARTS
jgi:hypothetical protein